MAQKAYSLSHTKWMCKYHIVFTPKYRRKVIYNQIRSDIGEILRKLCEYKGIEIIEGHLMPDHVHVLLAIPPKYSVASVMGYLKGKSSLMIFDRHANLKYKFGNRKFWAEGYYVSTVGLNEATIAKYIKDTMPGARVVFVGPCTAKKMEVQLDTVKPYVDAAMTFEELQALFDSREIDITALEEGMLDEASYFGRIFARCGGLAEAVAQGIKEHGHTDFELKATSCDGIEQCRIALFKKSKKLLDANFIEGMACTGGCIGGAGCLTHGPRSRAEVDKYGMEANDKTITEALAALEPKP